MLNSIKFPRKMLKIHAIHANWDEIRPYFIIYDSDEEKIYRIYQSDLLAINYEFVLPVNLCVIRGDINSCVSLEEVLHKYKDAVIVKSTFLRYFDDY